MKPVETADIDAHLDIDTIQAVLQKHPVNLAILFGSHATGTTHSSSDIDIAVEFDEVRPSDSSYNDVFFGLSVELHSSLDSDVDLVGIHTLSPMLVEPVFECGVLLIGEQKHVDELRSKLIPADVETQSPRERFDVALDKIDSYLDNSGETPATGGSENDK